MWKYVLFALLILPGVITAQYSKVEYFIDIDPGYGLATDVVLPQNDECDFVVDVNAIPDGFHVLYMRVRNTDGIWSQTVNRPFIKMVAAIDDLPGFVTAEYFIDTDPGYGKATAITGIAGDSLMFNADLTNITEGFHILYIRTLDSRGNWSQTSNRPFIKSSVQSSTLPNIVAAEYFIDSISESGSGIPIQITNPSSHTVADFMIELNDIDLGDHTIYVRAKDTNGAWGMIQNMDFKVCPFIQTTKSHSICEGESYQFGSQVLTVAGEYTEVFTTSSGCDSTVVLTLKVNPTFNINVSASICEGESYILGSQTLNAEGEYTEIFPTSSGCDSTVVLTLTVNPTFNKTVSASICEGDSYILGSQILTTEGEYTEIFTTSNGCDSVVVLSLSVNKIESSVLVINNTISSNENDAYYQWLDCNNGNEPIAGEINQTFIPATNGTYAVEISNNGCTVISDCLPFTITGIADTEKSQKLLKLYPNPSKGEFSVELANPMIIEIYNPMGEIVFSKQYTIGNHIISIQNIADGMYVVVAKNKSEVIYEKLQILK